MVIKFGDKIHWKKEEEKEFETSINCYMVTLHNMPFVDVIGNIDEVVEQIYPVIQKKGFRIFSIDGDPKMFLEKSINTVALLPGFWTCNCKTQHVRSSMVTTCTLCGCGILDSPKKIKYLSEIINYEA